MKPIQILWVNYSFTSEGEGVKTHTHPYYHFFVLRKGSLDITVENELFRISEGEALLVPKNRRHSYLNHSETTAEAVEIKFTLQSPGIETRLLEDSGNRIGKDEAIGLLAEKIVEEYSDLGTRADEAAKAYLTSILQILTRPHRGRPEADYFMDDTGFSELTRQVISYLSAHYAEPVSLDEMARELSFNKAYLCTAFKRDAKITIIDCLNFIRIRHAAKMISYSELAIGEVAKACGFGTASHFNHVFQHYIGTTPSAVRKAYPSHILLDSGIKGTHRGRLMYNVLAGDRVPTATLVQHD